MGFAVHELLAPSSPDAVRPLLADAVAFHSPVADYTGRDDVAHLLATIGRCVTDLRASHEYVAGSRSISEFTGRVSEHPVDGMLRQQIDSDGLVADAMLLLRPLAGLRHAVAMMRDALAAEPLPSRR